MGLTRTLVCATAVLVSSCAGGTPGASRPSSERTCAPFIVTPDSLIMTGLRAPCGGPYAADDTIRIPDRQRSCFGYGLLDQLAGEIRIWWVECRSYDHGPIG